jgi:hypothetical protein
MTHSCQCPWCFEVVSSAFERNLGPLLADHKRSCPDRPSVERALRDPLGRLGLTKFDLNFLKTLKIVW